MDIFTGLESLTFFFFQHFSIELMFNLRIWWTVFFFLIEHDFLSYQYFPHTVKKKKFQRKAILLNFIKSMDIFTGLAYLLDS
jgi:hypothetical protein